MKTHERARRELDIVAEKDKWNQIIIKYLLKKEMYFKGSSGAESLYIESVALDGSNILIRVSENCLLEVGKGVIIFKVLARYIQLECEVLEEKPLHSYVLKINVIKIAKKDRGNERVIAPVNMVWVTNIKTSKSMIDANLFNIPTSVKVNFVDYENRLRATADYIKIDTFKSINSLIDEKFNLVKKTQKILFISDTRNPESFKASSDDFLDYVQETDIPLNKIINEYRDQKVISELIVPVIYISPAEEAIPIGFVHLQSQTEHFDLAKVYEIKSLTFEMVDRIRESNLVINKGRYQVVDISTNGLKLKIDDPELIEQLVKIPGFSFDIFFKMQSPLTAFGLIKSVSRDSDNTLYLGIMIAGHSSRPGERERFIENVEFLKKNVTGR